MSKNEEVEIMRSLYPKDELEEFESKNIPCLKQFAAKVSKLNRDLETAYNNWKRMARPCPFSEDIIPIGKQVDYRLYGHPCCHPDNKELGLYGNCQPEHCPLS